jgi:hypothetical protein
MLRGSKVGDDSDIADANALPSIRDRKSFLAQESITEIPVSWSEVDDNTSKSWCVPCFVSNHKHFTERLEIS